MKHLELSREESIYLIESLHCRIRIVEKLISTFTMQSLIDDYTVELNQLVELKNKITFITNVDFYQNNLN